MHRRLFLTSAAAAAFAGAAGPALAQAAGAQTTASAQLTAALDALAQDFLLTSPETLTMLGLDTGENTAAKSRLDDRSKAKLDADKAQLEGRITQIKAIDRSALTPRETIYFDTLDFFAEAYLTGAQFPYGGGLFPSPYTVSQLSGSYVSLPDFLDSQHSIETAADAEAYLSRLNDFAKILDQETDRARAEHALGATPPDFILERTLTQLSQLTGTPVAQAGMVESIVRRTGEKGIAGDWSDRAIRIVQDAVYPALQRQADVIKAAQPTAVHDAGCWRLPDGEAYYAYGLKYFTTSTMDGEAVHRMGLEQVAELSAIADGILKGQGLTQGSVGERIQHLAKDPAQLYPNTDAGKAQLLQDLNAQMADMQTRLPQYFGRIPKSPVEVRRVPVATEAGAPGGYYQSPTLDGSRPGAYYINLRDTAEWPKWSLPTLTYHEASPGHHHQIALQQEQEGAPLLLKVLGFSAYAEGWGLYAEQLADEMGVYADNAIGRVGYLQSMMFRATRLVVDSGLHHKRWSREQAIRYMVDTLGDAETTCTTEVERYCVWPGQAASYKIGHSTIDRLRSEAKARLGAGFDIRGFHDTLLDAGSVPLTVLERVMAEWRG